MKLVADACSVSITHSCEPPAAAGAIEMLSFAPEPGSGYALTVGAACASAGSATQPKPPTATAASATARRSRLSSAERGGTSGRIWRAFLTCAGRAARCRPPALTLLLLRRGLGRAQRH